MWWINCSPIMGKLLAAVCARGIRTGYLTKGMRILIAVFPRWIA